MVLFSFYVEVFVENACVCIRLIGPTYVVILFIWLFAVFTVIYAVRLIIAFVDVNKTYLILSYLILNYINFHNCFNFKHFQYFKHQTFLN